MDYFVLACEILFIFFTVYYTVEEIIEVCTLLSFSLHDKENRLYFLDKTI